MIKRKTRNHGIQLSALILAILSVPEGEEPLRWPKEEIERRVFRSLVKPMDVTHLSIQRSLERLLREGKINRSGQTYWTLSI